MKNERGKIEQKIVSESENGNSAAELERLRIVTGSDSLFLCEDIRSSKLPPFMRRAISVTDNPVQQDILLLAAFTAVSYALPHIFFTHGQTKHVYYPNLMSLIMAPPASGKGVMGNAAKLLQPIDAYFSKSGHTVFSAGKATASSFLSELEENEGKLCIIESEIDTMSKNWKREGGDYSDMFRQTFEHETIRRSRMIPSGEVKRTEVKEPKLSVMLSGTPDQLRPLLGQGENGLASRFVPYLLVDATGFDITVTGDSGEDEGEKRDLPSVYSELGQQLYNRWRRLSRLNRNVRFRFTKDQDSRMMYLFNDAYYLGVEAMQLPAGYDPAVKRLLVNIRRMGAILSALRLPMNKPIPEVMYCTEDDFETLTILAEKLLRHTGLMMLMLQGESKEKFLPAPEKWCSGVASRNTKATNLLDMLPNRFTMAEAYAIGEKLGLSESTVKQRIARSVAEKKVSRMKLGLYRKR